MNVSPPLLVLSARQTAIGMSLRTKKIEPSQRAAFRPPLWRLRATIIRGRLAVESTRQGGLLSMLDRQRLLAPSIMSGSLLFGGLRVVHRPAIAVVNPRLVVAVEVLVPLEEGLLLDVWEDQDHPGAPAAAVAAHALGQDAVGVVVVVHAQGELL